MTAIRLSSSILALLILTLVNASGQNFPNRPVRIVVAVPGSAPDTVARVLAQGIAEPLGQSVVIDNRPALFIVDTLRRSTPDGHTIAIGGTTIWTAPLLQNTSYDAVRDLSPITLVASFCYILAVHPSLPVQSVKELISLAKAKPGVLNYAQGPPSGGVHLAGELFKAMAGISMVFVPYSGAALGVNATVAGETQMIIYNAIALIPHVKSGRLRALAVTSAAPTPLVPGVPTVAASGVPGYEYVSMLGAIAPAGTPAPNINRLNQEIVRVLGRANVIEQFAKLGADVVGSSPENFGSKIKTEIATMGKVIREAGIKAPQ